MLTTINTHVAFFVLTDCHLVLPQHMPFFSSKWRSHCEHGWSESLLGQCDCCREERGKRKNLESGSGVRPAEWGKATTRKIIFLEPKSILARILHH